MPYCAAFGCNNSNRKRNEGITFHRFPKEQSLRKLWVQAVNRADWEPTSYATLCSEHFLEKDMDRTSLSCVRVREGAVPSVFAQFVNANTAQTRLAKATLEISQKMDSSSVKECTAEAIHVTQEDENDIKKEMENESVSNTVGSQSDDEDEQSLEESNNKRRLIFTAVPTLTSQEIYPEEDHNSTDNHNLKRGFKRYKNSEEPCNSKRLSQNSCCFEGCSVTKLKCPNLHFYKFPISREDICEKWLANCKNESLRSIPLVTLRRRAVCEKHFTKGCFTKMKHRLMCTAVPTVSEEKYEQEKIDLMNNQLLKERIKRYQEMVFRIKEGHKKRILNRNKCCFSKCRKTKGFFPSLHFYRFPVIRKEICKQWILNCKNEYVQTFPLESLRHKIVCEKHFEKKCFLNNTRSRLKKDAVPTLEGVEDEVDRLEVESSNDSLNWTQDLSKSIDLTERLLGKVQVEIKEEEEIIDVHDPEFDTSNEYQQGPKSGASGSNHTEGLAANGQKLSDADEPSTSGILLTDPLEAGPSTSMGFVIKNEPCDDEYMSQDDSATNPLLDDKPVEEILPFSVVMVKQEPMDEEFPVKTEEVNIFDDHFSNNSNFMAETGGESILPDPIHVPAVHSNNDTPENPSFEITLLQSNRPENILPNPIFPESSQPNPQTTKILTPPVTKYLHPKPAKDTPVKMMSKGTSIQTSLLKPKTKIPPDTTIVGKLIPTPTSSESSLKIKKQEISALPIPSKIESMRHKISNSKTKKSGDDYDLFGQFVAKSIRSIKQEKYKTKLMRIIQNAVKGVCQEDLSTYTPETHLFVDT